jgi:hypothetical protein
MLCFENSVQNCHLMELLETGLELVIGFVEILQNVSTSNYSAIANSHTQRITTARNKSSRSAVSSPVVVC